MNCKNECMSNYVFESLEGEKTQESKGHKEEGEGRSGT